MFCFFDIFLFAAGNLCPRCHTEIFFVAYAVKLQMCTRKYDFRLRLFLKKCYLQMLSGLLTILLYVTFVGSGYSNAAPKQGTGECNSGKYS